MSHEATAWAFKQKGLSAHMRVVLWKLADCHNPQYGGCFPSQEYLAKECEISRRTVNNCLSELEEKGFIKRVQRRREDGTQMSTVYLLGFEFDHVQEMHTVKPCASESANRVQEMHTNLVIDSVNRDIRPARESELFPEPAAPALPAPDTFSEFWKAYPRKIGKDAASKSYHRALKSTSHPQIMAGLQNYCAVWENRGTALEYIPHAATWLNQSRFNDDLTSELNVTRNPRTGTRQGATDALGVFAGAAKTLSDEFRQQPGSASGFGDEPERPGHY